MNFISALFFSLLLVAQIACFHAPDGSEEASNIPNEGRPELSESSHFVTNTEDTKNSDLAEEYSPVVMQEITSSFSSSTSELEEVVTPTVAPATPSDDIEPSITTSTASSIKPHSQENNYVFSSVILIPPSSPEQIQSSEGADPGQIQSSEGAENVKESSYLEAVPTKKPEVLSSVLHTNPPAAISSKPAPTPPSPMTTKEDDDSITAALNQAEEESKPKEEEMPSFDEFKRRVLQEEEKSKQQSAENSNGTAHKLKPKKVKDRKQSNYASVDCGAKILEHNDEASNADSILVENKDLYMLNPCSAKVWFVVELCDIAHVKSIQIANFELFSSTPESFRVYVSKRYPTREWTMLGTFQAREERTIQTFPLDEPIYAKYFKVEMLSHFGSEHYCPLSLLRVYGSSMMEELEDHEIEGQDDNENSDSDSDVPVLPPEPGAKVDDEPKQPNLLERAADTVISLVKKITGNGQDKEKNGDDLEKVGGTLEKGSIALSDAVDSSEKESQAESKNKIVTLVGHEELEESLINNKANDSNDTTVEQDKSNANSQEGKSTSVNISSGDSSLCKEVANDEQSKTTSIALTPCQTFAQAIGPYCLGCFMGKLLFSEKQYQDFTFLDGINGRKPDLSNTTSSNGKSRKQMDKPNGEKDRDDEGEVNEQEVHATVQEKLTVSELLVEKNTPSESESQESSASFREPTSSNLDVKSAITVSIPLNVAETEDTSSRIIKPSQSVDILVEQKSGTSDNQTPSLVEVSVVTATPLNSTQSSSSSSVTLQSSELPVFEESNVIAVKEESDIGKNQTAKEPQPPVKQSLLPSGMSTMSDSKNVASVNKDTDNQPVEPLESKSISKEEKSKETAPDEIGEAIEFIAGATPAEAKVPNSLHMVPNSSSDIDVLETKLTDKEGREGTAEVVEDPLPVLNGALQDKQVTDSQNLNLESEDAEKKETSLNLESQEIGPEGTTSATVVESQSVGPTIQPASVPIGDISDLADSVLPLPAPPIVSVSSQEFTAAASDANLDAAMLSKAQQVAASSAGLSSVAGSGGHKESIFVRLSNKIKALEQNLNMSTLYMEQLNQRYRKSLDELQKNTDKKVTLLTNATKKAELVINSQKEQIAKMQSKLDNLTSVIAEMKARMDPLNKEVMERHVIGLCIEIVLILMLFVVFAKRNNNHNIPDTPRGSGHHMNGKGPPRLAIEDGHKDNVFKPTVLLSGREQLLRSFGKTPEPDTVGASTTADDNKLNKADPCNSSESKKKRNRKRKGSNSPDHEPPPDHPSSADSPSPASFVSRTAGLLFSSARGLLSGFHNPWKPKKPSSVHSDPVLSVRAEENHMSDDSAKHLKQPVITRARSLDSVPEETAAKRLCTPPSPPPLPPEFGVVFKRPPDCYYSKKGSVRNITPGPMKYGKYGVLDSQLA